MKTPTINDERKWLTEQINSSEALISLYARSCDPTVPGHTYQKIKRNRLLMRDELNRLDTLKTELENLNKGSN